MTARLRIALLVAMLLLVGVPTSMAVWDRVQLRTGWMLPHRQISPMLVIAHRGDVANFPENTAEAISSAAALNPDGIEFDVHQSADGTWWVLHDATVARTTDGEGAVRALTDARLSQLRIDGGFGFDSERHASMSIPRLRDVLQELADFQGLVIVDLQHAIGADPADLARQLDDVRAVVICRSAADASAIKTVNPRILTMMRSYKYERGHPVDFLLMDATREAKPGAVAAAPLRVFTFVDEGAFGSSESGWIYSAWSTGVHAYLTKDLAVALRERDRLAGEQPP